MATQKFTITHCPTYNKRLKQRGSLTVWMDELSIASWSEKTSLCGHLSLYDDNAPGGEAMAMVKALNRMRLLGMPNSVRIA